MLLTWYGDDFSGSTDTLEALSLRGVRSVLFLAPPDTADLARFPEIQAAGVAGISRSQSPAWMDEHLTPAFESLKSLGAPVCHYKVCSTFDSSPTHGSIGRAIEIGRRVFGTATVPVVVGAPVLRRYLLFGNLFAVFDGENYRIDRHPTMSRHPVTPMAEADLRCHLAQQTDLRIGLVDIVAIQAGKGRGRFEELRDAGAEIVFFDTLDRQTMEEAGRAIWDARPAEPYFVAGSSGVEYALVEWWQRLGLLPDPPPCAAVPPVDRLLVVSGSCSPVTAGQIEWALANGFDGVPIDPIALVTGAVEFERVLTAAGSVLARQGSPVVYSAAGPGSVVGGGGDFGRELGIRIGALAGELARRQRVHRILIAGGDTSGYAGQALKIQALTLIRPFAPGSPLCRMWSADPAIDGGEILFKGGQVGGKTLFGDVRADGSK